MVATAKKALPLMAIALLLAGCGVRGALQNPKSEGGAPQPTSTATAESGQNKPENTAPKQHSGFVLDGLLR